MRYRNLISRFLICNLVFNLLVGVTACSSTQQISKETVNKEMPANQADLINETEKSSASNSDIDAFDDLYEAQNLAKYLDSENNSKVLRYLKLNRNTELHIISYQDAIQKLEAGESFAVYYGWPDCHYCRNVIGTVLDVACETSIPLYVIKVPDDGNYTSTRTNYIWENGEAKIESTNADYDAFLNAFDEDNFPEYFVYENSEDTEGIDTGTKRMFAPTLLFVKHGSATIFSSIEWSNSDEYNSEKDKKQLKADLTTAFENLKD